MPSTYLLVINGKPQGPFTIEQLMDLKIKPGDFVRTGSMDDYKEAHEVAELRELLGFKEHSIIPQYFGSFDQRLLASALDWFLVSCVCIIPVFIIAVFADNKIIRISLTFGLVAIIPIVNFIYHVIMESSAKQGTYGKQLLHIKVCDIEGRPISFSHAAGRNLAKLLSVFTLFIGYLFSFFNKQQQCLHDMVAGTLVMKNRLF